MTDGLRLDGAVAVVGRARAALGMTARRQLLLAGLALVVAGGVATGFVLAFTGSSDAASTRARYFADVARICGVYGPRLDEIAPPPDVTIPGEVATPLKRVIPILAAETAEVRALRPPRELADRIARWLALKRRVLETLKRALAAAEAPNIPLTASQYLRFLVLGRQTARLGGQIGFPSICSASS